MDLSQFTPTNLIETFSWEIVEFLNKIEEYTHANAKETLESEMTQRSIFREKWLIGVTNIQVLTIKLVYNITGRMKKCALFILGNYEQQPMDFGKFRKQLTQNTVENTQQTKKI